VSGNLSVIGNITNMNAEATAILKYKKIDLID
jgi:hypothetical protein